MIRFYIIFITIILSSISFSQTEKEINKSIKKYKKNADKGILKLQKYMSKVDKATVESWNVLIDMEYTKLQKQVTNKQVSDMTYDVNKKSFLNLCRKATIISESSLADYHLRLFALEVNPDTLVQESIESNFRIGNKYFEEENYKEAIKYYHKAIKGKSNYYNAHMKLAISHWRDEERTDSTMLYLDKAKEIQPTYLEPYKLGIEVLMKKGLYFRAKKECLDGFCVYPGQDIKLYYQEILYEENKYYSENRLWRSFYLNNMKVKNQGVIAAEFNTYRLAKDKVKNITSKDGIIKQNDITNNKYLEVYSWHLLLDELGDDVPNYFEFAKQMDKEGYLDCYVLVSLFHFDIYPQFKHFMADAKNRERTKEYIEKYLIKTYN